MSCGMERPMPLGLHGLNEWRLQCMNLLNVLFMSMASIIHRWELSRVLEGVSSSRPRPLMTWLLFTPVGMMGSSHGDFNSPTSPIQVPISVTLFLTEHFFERVSRSI